MPEMDRGREIIEREKKSLWIATAPAADYPPPAQDSIDAHFDVAVVGGGIVGLAAAMLLKRSGAKVVLLEADEIAQGVSGHTTAKITAAHGLVYRHLVKKFGEEKARLYAEANQGAIDFIAGYIKENALSCDFRRTFACTYTPEAKDQREIEMEVETAAALGLSVSFRESADVPFPFKKGICYENQAFFHPRKYLRALAQEIPGTGSRIYERSRVMHVREGGPCEIDTDRVKIKADKVVIATNFPILNRGLFFAKMIPRRSYVIAFTVKGEAINGMYYSAAPPFHTFRNHETDDGQTFVLAGGEDHVTGYVTDTRERFRRLELFVKAHFQVRSIDYRWSTQDNDSMDKVPFIGLHSRFSKRIFTAAGFGGWGMTNGTAAGIILSDMITGKENPWSSAFDPMRTNPYRTGRFYSRNLHVANTFIKNIFSADGKSADELVPGDAGIIKIKGKKAAAFRDETGKIHTLSDRCTHMYCKLEWNNAERSWDCPCHGSRFDAGGKILHAPAVTNLKHIDSDEQ